MDFRNCNSLLRVLLKTPLRFEMITFTYFKRNASYTACSHCKSVATGPQLGTQESSDGHRNKATMTSSWAMCFLCCVLSTTMHNKTLCVIGCSQSKRLPRGTCFVIREQGWFEGEIRVISLILSKPAWTLWQNTKPGAVPAEPICIVSLSKKGLLKWTIWVIT
jgi:hypothetical protein